MKNKTCPILIIIISSSCPILCSYRQWREEQSERLSKKDTEENTALEDLKTQAKTELEEWYNRQEEQINQAKGLNR